MKVIRAPITYDSGAMRSTEREHLTKPGAETGKTFQQRGT